MSLLKRFQRELDEIDVTELAIRAVTFFLDLSPCVRGSLEETMNAVQLLIESTCRAARQVCSEVEEESGPRILSVRLALSPLNQIMAPFMANLHLQADDRSVEGSDLARAAEVGLSLAEAVDEARDKIGFDYAGGYSAKVDLGFGKGDLALLASLPKVLSSTKALYSNIEVASSGNGINLAAIRVMSHIIRETAFLKPERKGLDLHKLLVTTNMPGITAYLPAAQHQDSMPSFGIALCHLSPTVFLNSLTKGTLEDNYRRFMQVSTKTVLICEEVGKTIADRTGATYLGVDASISQWQEKSLGELIERLGVEMFGGHGTTFALALLNQAIRRGALMASSKVLGYTGAMTPMAEDIAIMNAVRKGAVSLDKLEAITSVCSMGLDMLVLPGDTPPHIVSSIIADQAAIGVVNRKPVGVRMILVPKGKPGDEVEMGKFGKVPIMAHNKFGSEKLMEMGDWVPGNPI